MDNFNISYTISNIQFMKVLCDLGVKINLTTLLVFKRLEVGEAKLTFVILQMIDKSIKRYWGVVEDLLVKVDKFIFLIDFITLDMEKDCGIPIIQGHLFLTIRRVLISETNENTHNMHTH